MTLSTDFGTLTLKGKIDRADKREENDRIYLRVIDYKSGIHPYQEKNLENGTDLQLMMYMNVLLSRFGNRAAPAGAYFMQISEESAADSPALSGPTLDRFAQDEKKAVTDEQFADLLNTATDTAQKLAEGILSGRIQAAPLDNVCRTCPYGVMCGHERTQIKEETYAELD